MKKKEMVESVSYYCDVCDKSCGKSEIYGIILPTVAVHMVLADHIDSEFYDCNKHICKKCRIELKSAIIAYEGRDHGQI